MPVYKLTPINNPKADWTRSSYQGPAVVRATSEGDARAIAAYTFQIPGNAAPASATPAGPWGDRSAVLCVLSHDKQFLETGPRLVLAPLDRARKMPQ
jgi:hypothetical protein